MCIRLDGGTYFFSMLFMVSPFGACHFRTEHPSKIWFFPVSRTSYICVVYGRDYSLNFSGGIPQADSNSSGVSIWFTTLWNCALNAFLFVHRGPRHSLTFLIHAICTNGEFYWASHSLSRPPSLGSGLHMCTIKKSMTSTSYNAIISQTNKKIFSYQ